MYEYHKVLYVFSVLNRQDAAVQTVESSLTGETSARQDMQQGVQQDMQQDVQQDRQQDVASGNSSHSETFDIVAKAMSVSLGDDLGFILENSQQPL